MNPELQKTIGDLAELLRETVEAQGMEVFTAAHQKTVDSVPPGEDVQKATDKLFEDSLEGAIGAVTLSVSVALHSALYEGFYGKGTPK